jgi:hypothetical protein
MSLTTAPTASRVALLTAPAVAPTTVPVLPAAAAPVAPPLQANPVLAALSEVASVVNTLIAPTPGVPPSNPLHLLLFEVIRHIERTFGLPVAGTPIVFTRDPVIGTLPVSTAPVVPGPGDVVQTPYGAVGTWLLEPGWQVSDFGGQRFDGRSLLEPINVILVDPTSTTTEQATAKFYADLSRAGFPAQAIHSTGFQGAIDGVTYGQQPTGLLQAFSDDFFLLPDDHARAFGPDPVETASGFVWTVAVSREQMGLYGLFPTHTFVSFDAARDELAHQLVADGATLVGIVPLSNAYDGPTATTADHDGYAVVVQLA